MDIEESFENKKNAAIKQLNKRHKRLLKAKEECLNHLNNCLAWEKVQHEANLLNTYFFRLKKGMEEIYLPDWSSNDSLVKLILDKKLTPKEEVAKRFKKAKKLKKGIFHQQKRLSEIEDQLSELAKTFQHLEKMETIDELSSFFPEKEIKEPKEVKEASLFRRFTSKSGFTILVGKKSASNDALTFRYAKGSDLWLHVKDYPGSHVVIVKPKGKEVDLETINEAAKLACFYSKAKDEAYAEVCLTEKKYVARLGKKGTGKVQISKQKTVLVRRQI